MAAGTTKSTHLSLGNEHRDTPERWQNEAPQTNYHFPRTGTNRIAAPYHMRMGNNHAPPTRLTNKRYPPNIQTSRCHILFHGTIRNGNVGNDGSSERSNPAPRKEELSEAVKRKDKKQPKDKNGEETHDEDMSTQDERKTRKATQLKTTTSQATLWKKHQKTTIKMTKMNTGLPS